MFAPEAASGLAGSLLGDAAAPAALTGMGGGTASLFGTAAAPLSADSIGALTASGMTPGITSGFTAAGAPSALTGVGAAQSPFSAFLSKAQPFIKGMAQAQQQMGGQQQQVAPPAGPPPSMQQQAPQISSAQILGGQGPSAQIAGALPPGSMNPQQMAQLLQLLKMRGMA
jgi:hypothetical protein